MPRIIAGFAGSLRLTAPAAGTRPTSDRVREGIFSALEARDLVRGARVLDLYAGSGALGLEAVSRGAASAVLVDSSGRATAAIRANVRLVRAAAPGGAPLDCRVVGRPVRSTLAALPPQGPEAPTLVFLDPPYDLDDAAVLGDLALLVTRAARGATLVLERSARSGDPAWPAGIEPERSRAYGDTRVTFLTVGDPAA